MATDMSQPAMNGGFNGQPSYGTSEPSIPVAGQMSAPNNINGAGASGPTSTTENANHTPPSKDEVGWYFVEQYYTNLSRSPEKLHV